MSLESTREKCAAAEKFFKEFFGESFAGSPGNY